MTLNRKYRWWIAAILSLWFVFLGSSSSLPQVWAASPGQDGDLTVPAAGTVVNRYTTLAASAATGDLNIQVGSAAALGLAPGDLILIVQMQGVSMNTDDTAAYGTITNYNNVGSYEFATVYSVTGNTINFCPCNGGLQRNYTVDAGSSGTGPGRVQVIRVPQYQNLTIPVGTSITAPAWNGTTGGIVAVHAQTTVTLNGAIDVSGLGFRGGIRDNLTSPHGAGPYTFFRRPNSTDGAEKGESVFGFTTDYDTLANGRYARGAPANGGGGGNAHNAGGGGGANGDNGVAWNGQGNPDPNPAWTAAWNLDTFGPGFAGNTSSGGGRGGYSFSWNNEDALITGPGSAAWSGDNRNNVGGYGGRPLNTAGNRYFMGGGGGAGDGNDTASYDGADGGGMVFLVTPGTVTGAGQIRANGANAGNTIPPGNNDAPGGGGGGGSVVVNVGAHTGTISIEANGGTGGNQLAIGNEAEGPGGGGGGGVIATAGGAFTTAVAGGANGTTQSTSLTEFPPNGATRGASGRTEAAAVSIPSAPCMGVAKAVTSIVAPRPYTVSLSFVVQNLGTEPLTNVQVTDNAAAVFNPYTVTVVTPPAVIVSGGGSLTGNAAYNGSTNTNLLAAGGTLNVAASATITVTIRVDAPGGTTFNNTATGTATGSASGGATSDISQNGNDPDPDGDGNPGNNSDPTPIIFPGEPPTLSKVFAPPVIAPGAVSVLTITIDNSAPGTSNLTNVGLTDNLPGGIVVAPTPGASTTCGGTVTAMAGANIITLAGGTLNAGMTCTITVNVTGSANGDYANVIPATNLTNTQGVAARNPAGAGLRIGALPTGAPALAIADPYITKSVFPPFALPGEEVTWQIIVHNPGAVALTNVVIRDVAFPDVVEITSVTTTAGSVTQSGQSVTITIPTLGPGQSVTVTVKSRVRANSPAGIFLNEACLTAEGLGTPHCAQASLLIAQGLPTTGETPWWRQWLLVVGGLAVGMGGGLWFLIAKRSAKRGDRVR